MSESITEAQQTLAIAAELLSYPDAQWRERLGAVRKEAAELADRRVAQTFGRFLDAAQASGAQDFETAYVSAFDFNKKTSLYLTSRKRNDAAQQRADLLAYSLYYTESGYTPDHELPDYLPALLELAAAVDIAEAGRIMRGARNDLVLLRDALKEEGIQSYRLLIDTVIAAGEELEQEAAA
jgi:nitrate reductase delta subunit